MIDNGTKEQIRTHLCNFCEIAGSDNKAAGKLGISNNYISSIKSRKSDKISDDMWRKIAHLVGLNLAEQWTYAETTQSIALREMFEDSSLTCNVYGIIVQPGSGKTFMLDRVRLASSNVFYVKCTSEMRPKDFYYEILRSMGKNEVSGYPSSQLRQIENEVERRENPLIVIDEIERVANKVLRQFIDLYNVVHRKCGIVILGTPNLEDRVRVNRNRCKIDYNTWFSRIGLNFTKIPAPNAKDAGNIIRANGISDMLKINEIINKSVDDLHGGVDLRRVERLVTMAKAVAAKAMAADGRISA